MEIVVEEQVRDGLLDDAWKLYEQAFRHLNTLTVQRHLMHRSEFDEVCWDQRVQKWLAFDDDGQLVGLATYTNILESMPLISPEYFARRWPEHFALSRVWYCGFVAVAPGSTGSGVFMKMITGMYQVAERDGGVIGLDFCRHNDQAFRIGKAIELSLRRISGGRVGPERADEQVFMIYETAPSA